MTHSSPIEPLEALPIPAGAVLLPEALWSRAAGSGLREERRLAIAALRQAMAERALDLPLGPQIDPEDPDRLLVLNRFALQLSTTGFCSDETAIAADLWQHTDTAPQLLLLAAIDEENGAVHFPGVLTGEEVVAAAGRSLSTDGQILLPVDAFRGGIDRLFTLVQILDPRTLPRRSWVPQPQGAPVARVLDWLQGLLPPSLDDLGASLVPLTAGAFRQAGAGSQTSGEAALAALSIPLGLSAEGEVMSAEAAGACIERFRLLLLPCGEPGEIPQHTPDRLLLRLVGELEGDLLPDGLQLSAVQGNRRLSVTTAASAMVELTVPASDAPIEVTVTPAGGQPLVLPPLQLPVA